MSECIFKWVKKDDLMVGVNTAGPIDDKTWAAFMEDFTAGDFSYYIGGTLGILEVSPVQRRQAAVALREHSMGLVVITDDVLVRGVVTAVSWLGAKVRSFAWKDFDRAMDHINIVDRKQEVTEILDRLRAECLAELEAQREERRRSLHG
ncbi:hypothetical protein G6O69_08890 [Pseudenhygromyxa sp. WMMC2535]|uniref:hypothetical protein n=1 Tax=Pseudenhygromyxa sp. WMMC2535 TaxID=2712867 RepID=UPI001552DAFA|nr:hypothetical protein [Pseudenhygromyxa sp. WMMC2535]NVB37950.1 hypothetical protein [Pseudenhygromyxa sp. WMMC2535]